MITIYDTFYPVKMFLWDILPEAKVQVAKCESSQKHSLALDNKEVENDLAEYIIAKGYLPNEKELPVSSVINNSGNDMAYILSKLSDEELVKLLNSQPKKDVYDLNDIVKITLGDKSPKTKSGQDETSDIQNSKKYALHSPSEIIDSGQAFYKLNHRPIEEKPGPNFYALKKLHSLLYSRPRKLVPDGEPLNDQKRELLFDILVAQLKTLCCKTEKHNQIRTPKFNALLENIMAQGSQDKAEPLQKPNKEFMFLILNEEIKSKDNDDLILVDPDTLERNSSVLLLGPITTPLTNDQLKVVMDRISNELSKPEYASFLQQLSDGTFNENNSNIMKNFLRGPNTRRYIKAHRCNHQSKLAKIYGGPKWLICTGYLNLNKPSLYD